MLTYMYTGLTHLSCLSVVIHAWLTILGREYCIPNKSKSMLTITAIQGPQSRFQSGEGGGLMRRYKRGQSKGSGGMQIFAVIFCFLIGFFSSLSFYIFVIIFFLLHPLCGLCYFILLQREKKHALKLQRGAVLLFNRINCNLTNIDKKVIIINSKENYYLLPNLTFPPSFRVQKCHLTNES